MEAVTELSPLSATEKQAKIAERSSYYPQEPDRIPRNRRQKVVTCLRQNILTFLTIVGVVGGVLFGIILRNSQSSPYTAREIMYLNFAGDLFLRMLKSLILPLIMSSLISAIGSLDLSLSGKIGARAIVYYMITTISAVILGIILVISIRPGDDSSMQNSNKELEQNSTTVDTLLDLVRNMFPPNLVQACISQGRTESRIGAEGAEEFYEKDVSGMNILGLVVFSTVLGITLGRMDDSGKPLLKFFESLSAAMMMITNWVIWLSPVGVFFLVASKIVEMKSIEQVVSQLGMYFITVLVGLCIHGFGILPALFFVITRRNPYRYLSNLAQALVTAFGTSSSSATLPVAINCLEERNGIDPRITRFVLPIGATINMDGTALYEAVAAIFIAQVRKVSLSFGKLVAISITATAASIGAAGIPQAGLVTMVMVLDTVHLPSKDVFLILAVDWLLDRCRTTINVMGDSLGAGIVHHLSKNELVTLPQQRRQTQQNGGGDHQSTTSI